MPEARFSTGEFAALCGTTKATLFHYDKMGILSPQRDPQNNYRYYTDKQVSDFDAIASLTEIGTPLSEIRELRENWDMDKYLDLLRRKEREMQEREERLQAMRDFLRFIREETERYAGVTGEELEFRDFPAVRYAVGPGGELAGKQWRSFVQGTKECIRSNRSHRPASGVSVGSIILQESMEKGCFRPSYFYSSEENADISGGLLERPAGTYAVFYHVGERSGLGPCVQRTLPKIRALGWRLAGNAYLDSHLNTLVALSPGTSVFPIHIQVEKE